MERDLAVISRLPSFSSMDADQPAYIRYDKEIVIIRYILRFCIRGFCHWTERGSIAGRQRF
jgi:hypothetical protein